MPTSIPRLPANQDAFQLGGLSFGQATTPEDLECVHKMNYRSLVQELGQYPDDGSGRHVDKFHDKNLYFFIDVKPVVLDLLKR